MKAIATTYRGTRFRSRLESRWAAFFDLLGFEWQYEPFDARGYIPDFLLNGALLCEVKPHTQLVYDDGPIVEARNAVAAAAADRSYAAALLGESWTVREWFSVLDWEPLPLTWDLKIAAGDLFAQLGPIASRKPLRHIGENDFERLWRTAQSRVQWRPNSRRGVSAGDAQ